MHSTLLLVLSFVGANTGAQTPGSVWDELRAKREALLSLHQEFDLQQAFETRTNTNASKRQMILDIAGRQWREEFRDGSGGRVRIFDGKDLFSMDVGGSEYVRGKRKAKDSDPLPYVYDLRDADWSKAVEVQRIPCGLTENDWRCVVLEVPLRESLQSTTKGFSKVWNGKVHAVLDLETGMAISVEISKLIEPPRGSPYKSEATYVLKRMSYGASADTALFKLPSDGMTEVKELSRRNAREIKRQLVGSPAPDLNVLDITGNRVVLAAFKGKTVLLDFWTTWCAPCRADAPALDKLYRKYGGEKLMIVGISVSEDRMIVEKYLKDHPHSFPVVLTTENDMPRPYQIGAFPTYIVIDADGRVEAAVEGDQGFGTIRNLLKKAGMETK
jgi:thiol-disulfide isomerase/thioredoxin